MEDTLTIAVQGVHYYLTCPRVNGLPPTPVESITVIWFMGRHPCDDQPYLELSAR